VAVSAAATVARQLAFLVEVDRLKGVLRQTPLCDGSRRENSAEHSWHLALAAVVLAEHAGDGVDVARVVRMTLVHDVVEIDAGDTFAYDPAAQAGKEARERAAADRLFGTLPPEQAAELRRPVGRVRGAGDARGALRERARPLAGGARHRRVELQARLHPPRPRGGGLVRGEGRGSARSRFPPSALAPTSWGRCGSRRSLGVHQVVEALEDDAALQLAVERDAEVVSHGEGEEDRARRPGVLGDVPGDRGRDGRDAPSFDGALDQRDALVAEGSGGRGERDVGALLATRRRDVLGQRPLQPLGSML
jgi:putative hydrolase of HD superfamily